VGSKIKVTLDIITFLVPDRFADWLRCVGVHSEKLLVVESAVGV